MRTATMAREVLLRMLRSSVSQQSVEYCCLRCALSTSPFTACCRSLVARHLPFDQASDTSHVLGATQVDLTRYVERHIFSFDDALDAAVSNDAVYRSTVQPLVATIFKAGKATCFAYGQTGAQQTASNWLASWGLALRSGALQTGSGSLTSKCRTCACIVHGHSKSVLVQMTAREGLSPVAHHSDQLSARGDGSM